MNVEIITIGDELISGLTVDSNGAFIARKLAEAGFTVTRITSVGDGLEPMEEAFRTALQRVGLVIVTGGLGPTDDDMTKRAIVRVFKRNLIFHDEILDQIKARFKKMGRKLPPAIQSQALQPQGARFFPNRHGSAVGICIDERNSIFIALPGVPFEMEQIMVDEVLPYLSNLKVDQIVKTVLLRTTGIGESKLAEMIKPKLKLPKDVKLAYLPSPSGVSLRITAVGKESAGMEQRAQDTVRHLEKTVGKYIFGRDDENLEKVIGRLLADNDKTVSVAESCTAGGLGAVITAVSGSSVYFTGGILAYDNQVKISQLGVPAEIIQQHGAVSEECAVAMAIACRKLFATDYALAITGIAGPEGGTVEKPVGTIWIGLASAHTKKARLFHTGGNRQVNRTRAIYAALELLRREILDLN